MKADIMSIDMSLKIDGIKLKQTSVFCFLSLPHSTVIIILSLLSEYLPMTMNEGSTLSNAHR